MSRERGFAMIAILSLAALISAYLIASTLNLNSAGISNEREQRSMNALRQAKAALIAYAASEQWKRYKGQTAANQPGALPCPDGDNDGDSDGICPNALLRIGRLPWKTIGSADLTDASGERLWYAVSSNFYTNAANIINSDTPGLLTVAGTAPVANVVAIVFAPGPAIQDFTLPPGQVQDRSLVNINRLASYLEGFTVGAPNYTFTTNALPTDTFNDRLLVITQAELMAAVEPVVAARIERDIKSYITQNYSGAIAYVYGKWTGGYPFAVPWGGGPGQPQDNYKGDPTTIPPTYRGLMPITRDPGWVAWEPTSANVVQVGGIGAVTSTNCGASTATEIVCVVDYTGASGDRPHIQLTATLNNAGRSFVNAAVAGNSTIFDNLGFDNGWSTFFSPNPWTVSSTLQADGNGTVTFIGALTNGDPTVTNRPVTIRVTVPAYHPISSEMAVAVAAASNASPISITTSTPHGFSTGVGVTISGVSGNTAANGNWTVTMADSTHFTLNSSTGNGSYISGGAASSLAAWFIANRWYRQTYYAVAQGYVSGGGSSCTAGVTCLTVSNLPAPLNNGRLVLVFGGRALDGQTRPPNTLMNYFEGLNSTDDLFFEHRSGPPTTINDRVVVVAP